MKKAKKLKATAKKALKLGMKKTSVAAKAKSMAGKMNIQI